MKHFLLLTIPFLFLYCNSHPSTPTDVRSKEEKALNKHDSNDIFLYCDSVIAAIESQKPRLRMLSASLLKSGCELDSLPVRLYVEHDVLRMVNSSTYDCEGGDTGEVAYLFDSSGKLIAEKFFIGTSAIVYFFAKSLPYEKTADGNFHKLNLSIDNYWRVQPAKELCDMMQFFPEVQYTNIDVSDFHYPSLKTLRKADLMEQPDRKSKVLSCLNPNTYLTYLATSSKRDTVDGIAWVWYKVKTEQQQEGWLWGYPLIVDFATDDN